ncbi:MAG: hypothetical protein JF615_11730, partial [Asticcacaulis sp.]|nr:hypothetical protein [Asticcacaulis sp.]
MDDTSLDPVHHHIALLDGLLRTSVRDFGREEVLAKIEDITAGRCDFGHLSESEAAHT